MIRITTGEGQLVFDPSTAEWEGDQLLVEIIDIHQAHEQGVTPVGPFIAEDQTDEQWQLLHAMEALTVSSISFRLDEWPAFDVPPGCLPESMVTGS